MDSLRGSLRGSLVWLGKFSLSGSKRLTLRCPALVVKVEGVVEVVVMVCTFSAVTFLALPSSYVVALGSEEVMGWEEPLGGEWWSSSFFEEEVFSFSLSESESESWKIALKRSMVGGPSTGTCEQSMYRVKEEHLLTHKGCS